MRVDLKSQLNDRERILLTIIRGLETTRVLAHIPPHTWSSAPYFHDGRYYVHVASWDEPQPGDLVMAQSGGIGEWTIAWYVSAPINDYWIHVVREIGTSRLCNYGNESFHPIRGLSPLEVLEGEQYQFYLKVLRAFGRGDEYSYRFGGLRFDGENAFVGIREVFGGMGLPSTPFEVEVPFRKRISVKTILTAMRLGGYGTRKFRELKSALEKEAGE